MPHTPEHHRLEQAHRREANWQRWGPYLAERQWGTVREDYSDDGSAWTYFPHDHARSRAYRWGEDGLLGWTDRECRLCFALALWNGKDPILKERLFGLTGPEGNHGEDVKEHYFYLDACPTNAYAKASYHYPHAAFPYDELVHENANRSKHDDEYEIAQTGVFNDNRYFIVTAEYAKAGPDDTLIRITITNAGPDPAELTVLPTLWFRNTWVWGCQHEGCTLKPNLEQVGDASIACDHETLGKFRFDLQAHPSTNPEARGKNSINWLFTENHTNRERLFDSQSLTPYVKDAFHEYLIQGQSHAVNPKGRGTKTAAVVALKLEPGASHTLLARLRPEALADEQPEAFGSEFAKTFDTRINEADAFYDTVLPPGLSDDDRLIARQAYAGLLWSKQFYHYVVEEWLEGDPNLPPPPESRNTGRNEDWKHLFARDVLSMPDKWEYPWFAAWDTAFHMIPMAQIDPHWAKKQLGLFLREWYLHPNGQIPAYEFAFDDVNPPVHAWAVWRTYKLTGERGQRDKAFLASAFQKLLLNFTWWVNRKDPHGHNVFAGGFLGLDNIGVFDRSQPLPQGQTLTQSDGTAWMAFYCSTMMSIALELAEHAPGYEDMASKFFEHFIAIADAIHQVGGTGLWHQDDGFYYDHLGIDGHQTPIRLRSLVGLMPLIAVQVFDRKRLEKLKGFSKRMNWFLKYRPDLAQRVSLMSCDDTPRQNADRMMLAVPSREKLTRVLGYMLDEDEFLSPFGIRSMSKRYAQDPFTLDLPGQHYEVRYEPAESRNTMFGGNSNWRGPIWFPINYLLIESLQRYHHFYGDTFTIEYPTGSGKHVTLDVVAEDLMQRLANLFRLQPDNTRVATGQPGNPLFYEYFNGDTGQGLARPTKPAGPRSSPAACTEHDLKPQTLTTCSTIAGLKDEPRPSGRVPGGQDIA